MNTTATILIISDRSEVRQNIESVLVRHGFRVLSQRTEQNLYHHLRPHLVIMDGDCPLPSHSFDVPQIQLTDTQEASGEENECSFNRYFLSWPTHPMVLMSLVRAVLRLKRANESLVETKENLKLALKSSRMAVWYWDVESDQIQYSESFNELFGRAENYSDWSYDEFIQLIHDEDRARVESEIDDVFQGKKNDFYSEFRVVWSDQSVHWLTGRGEVVRNEESHVVAVRGAFVDIQQLKEAVIESGVAREAAEGANRAKTEFLANMSHEIRTPISAILGFAHILIDTNQEHQRKDLSERIKSNGAQLLRLIDDILDLSKVEAGLVPIKKEAFVFTDLLSDTIRTFSSPTAEKGVHIEVELSRGLNEVVYSDPVRVRQILSNLIGNAVKFSSKNGRVQIRVTSEDLMSIEIEDHGIGMSEADQKRIFQPFSQAHESICKRYGGNGLGLVLSKRLACALGGSLELVWTKTGQGSCFKVTFDPGHPQERMIPARETEVNRPAPQGDPQPLRDVRVLLVDDSPDNEELIRFYLMNDGAAVDVAHDGYEALQRAQSGVHDIVLMDVQMPGMDGLEATKQLREKGYRTPIIALTAHALQEEVNRSFSAGCNAHLTKPFTRQELMNEIMSQIH